MATEEEGGKILQYLKEHGSADSMQLAKEWNEPHQKIVGTVKSLLSLGNVIEAVLESSSQWVLTGEGQGVISAGSHEALVYNAVPAGGSISQAEIQAKIPFANVGFGIAMSNGWIAVDKTSGTPSVIRIKRKIEDIVQKNLTQFDELDASLKEVYKKRKLLKEITVKSYKIRPGPSFTSSVKKQDTDLTPEMISSKMRQIFLEMGFTEMPPHNLVESSSWNFDALFQPQQHPA